MTDKFLTLLRISMGIESPDGFDATPQEWSHIYSQAKKQAVIAVMSRGLNAIEGEGEAPFKVYSHWMVATEMIQKKNEKVLSRSRELYENLVSEGKRCCILKGQGNASYYPDPTLRQCGDIDIWVDGKRSELYDSFSRKCLVKKVFYHHFDAGIFPDVDVEVHCTPSWMNSLRLNLRMQKFILENAPAQFANFRPELGFAVPLPEFNIAYNIFHIFRHFFAEGIGLRQPMDLYFQLLKFDPLKHARVMDNLRHIGLGRFTAALMYAMQEIFHLPDECLLCAPDERYGRRLVDDMLSGGNFGRHGKKYKSLMQNNFIKRALHRTLHVLSLVQYCPADALAAPLFKLWQHIFITGKYA